MKLDRFGRPAPWVVTNALQTRQLTRELVSGVYFIFNYAALSRHDGTQSCQVVREIVFGACLRFVFAFMCGVPSYRRSINVRSDSLDSLCFLAVRRSEMLRITCKLTTPFLIVGQLIVFVHGTLRYHDPQTTSCQLFLWVLLSSVVIVYFASDLNIYASSGPFE